MKIRGIFKHRYLVFLGKLLLEGILKKKKYIGSFFVGGGEGDSDNNGYKLSTYTVR